MNAEESEEELPQQISEEVRPKKRKKRVLKYPTRELSAPVQKPREIVLTLNRKRKPKKLRQCQQTPLTLYELAAMVVDALPYPDTYNWGEDEVVMWLSDVIGLPQYKECIYDNYINGRRLIWLEDPSVMPMINIHDFEHIKMITRGVRQLFAIEFVLFTRSVGLPPRKPLTHCTWFKSRTGPPWGIRTNWTRSDILRWMQIIMPKPLHLDHWDLVWYMKPDFVRVLFGRVPFVKSDNYIPIYKPIAEICFEYEVPRKFRIQQDLPVDGMIWMEHTEYSKICLREALAKEEALIQEEYRKVEERIKKEEKVMNMIYELKGKEFILARRLLPKVKFMPNS